MVQLIEVFPVSSKWVSLLKLALAKLKYSKNILPTEKSPQWHFVLLSTYERHPMLTKLLLPQDKWIALASASVMNKVKTIGYGIHGKLRRMKRLSNEARQDGWAGFRSWNLSDPACSRAGTSQQTRSQKDTDDPVKVAARTLMMSRSSGSCLQFALAATYQLCLPRPLSE